MFGILFRFVGAAAVLAWLAFTILGETFGWQGIAAAASLEAWLYTWVAFPILLAFSLGAAALWIAVRSIRWANSRQSLERLAGLQQEGARLRALGQDMTDPATLPAFVRGTTEWEERVHEALGERSKVEAVTFRAPIVALHPELRTKYFSEQHRVTLENHAERVRRLGRIVAKHAIGG